MTIDRWQGHAWWLVTEKENPRVQNAYIVCKLQTRNRYKPHESFLAKRCGFFLPFQHPVLLKLAVGRASRTTSLISKLALPRWGVFVPRCLCRVVAVVRFWPRGSCIPVPAHPPMVFEPAVSVPLDLSLDKILPRFFL